MKRFVLFCLCTFLSIVLVSCLSNNSVNNICFFRVEDTDQAGIDSFCEHIKACESRLGIVFDRGATIKFEENAEDACFQGENVGGCWWLEYDLIVVEKRLSLEETALCHELLHRQLWITMFDADYAHKNPFWELL